MFRGDMRSPPLPQNAPAMITSALSMCAEFVSVSVRGKSGVFTGCYVPAHRENSKRNKKQIKQSSTMKLPRDIKLKNRKKIENRPLHNNYIPCLKSL